MGTPASAALVRALDRRLQEGVFEPVSLPDLARLMGVGDGRVPLRPAVRALPHPPAAVHLGDRQRPAPGRARGAGDLRPHGRRDAGRPDDRRDHARDPAGHPEPAGRRAVPRRATRCRSCARSGRTPRCSSPATPRAWWTPPPPACSPTAASSCSRPTSRASPNSSGKRWTRAPSWSSPTATAGGPSGGTRSARTTATSSAPTRSPSSRTRATTGCPSSRTPATTARPWRSSGGVVSVEATDYGNPVGYAPADRPDYAVDGDVTTAWRVGAFSDVRGEKLKISMAAPGDDQTRSMSSSRSPSLATATSRSWP